MMTTMNILLTKKKMKTMSTLITSMIMTIIEYPAHLEDDDDNEYPAYIEDDYDQAHLEDVDDHKYSDHLHVHDDP